MEVVILHYHLNHGGVTSVIENHLNSLATLSSDQQPSRVTVVCGGRFDAWNAQLAEDLPFACEMAVVEALEYDHFRTGDSSLLAALAKLLQAFDRDSTVLHIHNHSLGKNAQMTDVVSQLAALGWKILLQLHDFAEDLRPANYQHLVQKANSIDQLQAKLYPQAEQIHYAVLNGRDRKFLQTAGIPNQRLELLPNPVLPFTNPPNVAQVQQARSELFDVLKIPTGHRLVLYPVRPIRRKNLGELLLWSLLVENTTFMMTMAPLNPQEQTSYRRWVEFAQANQLPVEFEVAKRVDLPFELVYAAADAILTTSIAEGFGMVYLEASLAQRPLVGRKLPDICSDFELAGTKFPGLATDLKIPTAQVDLMAIKQSHRRWLEQLCADYGLPLAIADEQSSVLFSGNVMDYARSESGQQRDFLQRVKTEAKLRATLRELNPHLQAIVSDEAIWHETHEHNGRVIAENYSPAVIGKQLMSMYESMLLSHPSQVLHDPGIAQSILQNFVAPQMLYPIRIES